MPTGLTTAWGYSPTNLGGFGKTMEYNNIPLTYQLSLTSIPPSFPNGKFQSPITPIAIGNMSAFGRSKRVSKSVCKEFLKKKSINPVTGRKIKRSGKTFKNLMKECERHGLLKKKKI